MSRVATDFGIYPMPEGGLPRARLAKYARACDDKGRRCWSAGIAFEPPNEDEIDTSPPHCMFWIVP